METLEIPRLAFYPPAPTNGGSEITPRTGAHVWQPKVDDRRVALHPESGTIYNQYGSLSVAHLQAEKFAQAMATLKATALHPCVSNLDWLDCGIMEYRHDMMRGCIIVFDLMDPTRTFDQRREILEALFEPLPMATELLKHQDHLCVDRVWLINQFEGYGDTICHPPVNLWAMLQEENAVIGRKFYEGVVAKRRASLYPQCFKAKQTTPAWVKHRFDQ